MKIYFNGFQPVFRGRREDRNTASQLKNNNNYALNEPNQRRINNAIDNLSKYSDEENIEFLLDVAENLQYGTNIDNGKPVKNDWKAKLQNAAETSIAHSNPILKEKYEPKFNQIFHTQKPLTNEEKAIIELKNSIMQQADLKSLKSTNNENIRSLERNMDYFITSTEVPTQQKLYVLKRLNYFMSPEYEINPQLTDKKTQVLAEMVNDISVNTSESKIPNIKAINQKSHGMCAGISIVRKAIAYEDKPNYVDSLLSELDNTDKVMIYDRFNLGSGKRIPVKKAYIDFNYAIDKGYRIVDASVGQWMNIADMYGINNENLHDYNTFDKLNFDAFQDSHFVQNFANNELMRKQCYYQALSKAQDEIGNLKSSLIKQNERNTDNKLNFWTNLEASSKENSLIRENLKTLMPELNNSETNHLTSTLISLQKQYSDKISKDNKELAKYSFIPNEEYSQKVKKVKQYLLDTTGIQASDELEKTAKRITDSIININSITKKISPEHTLADTVKSARQAYEAEASYRAGILVGLSETDVLTDYMIKYNIPDRESRISNSLGKLINILETTDNPELTAHFANMFRMNPEDKEDILRGLQAVKANFDSNMTEVLDDLYYRMGLGSRKDVLLSEVLDCKDEIKNGNKKEQSRIAEILNINNDKKSVLNVLEKFEQQLSNENVSEETYLNILNKIGYKNQVDIFVDKFQEVVKSLTDETYPNREENLEIFKRINNLDENADTQEILNVFNNTGETFNNLSNDIEVAASIIGSVTPHDTAFFSGNAGELDSLTIDARDLIVKKLENRGELVPAFVMKELQERFTKIDKIRSSDEFSSRHGKISQPELYKLTPAEKAAIKQINKKANKMYADVTKALKNQFREIKPELEELARYVGTSSGYYWVSGEGHSGLRSSQEVKIFEQITDKPYYAEENLETAVDRIIDGVRSGVSSTSVFHDRMGAHAQYIADIKKEGPQDKYVLYHDNSWGASEHENIWVDSEGITRTDYSDRRGGELGYITDDNWRNGNYIENLATKKGRTSPEIINSKTYKKINPAYNDSFDFSMVDDIIINGTNPMYKKLAGSIKDTAYIPDKNYIPMFEKAATTMSMKELESYKLLTDSVINIYKDKYEKILKRIEKTPFNNGINSKEEYDRLPDNDSLKLALEKVAVKLANPNFYMYHEMGRAKTMNDVRKIEQTLKTNAKNDFYYAFGKSKDNLLYYAYEHSREVSGKLIEILTNNNVKFSYDNIPEIFKNTAYYEKNETKQFTGSIKDSIDFVVNKTMKKFDENMQQDENLPAARKEFETYLRNTLNEIMYFNEEDLKSNKFRAKAIRKWVDRTFEPKNDKEFVKIYKKLQDMPTEEFNRYTTNLTNEDLGIKPVTGYDVLVKIKAANENTHTDLKNTLFYDEYVKDVKLSETKPSYKYQKNQKSLRGAMYKNGRTFDDMYTSFVSSLSILTYEQMFDKYKDRNFRKYKAMPAYPKVDLVTDNALNNKISSIEKQSSEILNTVKLRKNIMNTMNLVNKLNDYISRIPDNRPFSPKELQNISVMAGEYITNNFQDPDVKEGLQAAFEILNMPVNTPAGQYKPLTQTIVNEYKMLEKINAATPFKQINDENITYLKQYHNATLECNIPPRFRRIVKEDLENWITEEFKKKDKTLSNRQSSLEVRSKLDEYSIKNHTKGKIEKFTTLQSYVNIAKTLQYSEEPDKNKDEYNKAIAKANKLAENYISQYIKPEYRNQAAKLLKNYITRESGIAKTNSYDANRSQAAKEKFVTSFKKYHYTKYPLETFDSYLKTLAKDSTTSEYKNNFKALFENHLNFSTLIEMQDLLMEAVATGNAAEVKNHFKDYYVYPFNSNFPQTMDSPESISYIVKNLLINNNNETAKMFVEKLGLADTILDFEAMEFDNFNLDKHVKSIISIATATQKNMQTAKTEVDKLSQIIDKSDNFEQLIDETKENIIKQTKRNNRKSEIKIYL